MEPTRILGSFEVKQITIFNASPNSIPPAIPLPSIPSVSDYDERSIKGYRQRPWTLTFSPTLVEKIQVVVRDLGFNALADVERAVPLMLAAFPEAHMLELQVMNYTAQDSIVSVHLSSYLKAKTDSRSLSPKWNVPCRVLVLNLKHLSSASLPDEQIILSKRGHQAKP
jgi:hypothetical protein